MENVERLGRGELTEEERRVQRVIEIETTPKGARIRVDGKEAETEKQNVKKTIIVFVEVPKKIRIDLKKEERD